MDYDPNKRERILNAAAQLIISSGLQTSMSTIAAEAGVATGSLYNYFQSKEDLVFAVYQRVATSLEADLLVEVDRALPYEERVAQYVGNYVDHIWKDANRAMLYEVITNSPLVMQERLGELFAKISSNSVEVFSEGLDLNAQRAMSPSLTGSFVRGSVRNVLKRHRAAGGELTPQLRARIIQMCLAALALR